MGPLDQSKYEFQMSHENYGLWLVERAKCRRWCTKNEKIISSKWEKIRYENELERNITIKLGYSNAKIYRCDDIPRHL